MAVRARFVLAGLLVLPFLWFVPPWVSTGQPFLAASHAASYNGHLGSSRLHTVLARGIDEQVLPALIGAVIAIAIGWWRRRDRILLAIGAAIVAWWVVVVGMTLDGYPGLERFFLPAAALTCVLGGVGVAWLAGLAGDALSAHRGLVAGATALILIAVSIPFTHRALGRDP